MRERWTQELVDALRAIPKLEEKAFDSGQWPPVQNRIDALDALLDQSTQVNPQHGLTLKCL